ncbi:uncharacterized protein STAUR_0982 [Stigmatella aurantiaca DW4/3-1]|uniref:Uncharacterized protein n=1 Tax=Stigmatella aurantiaca (strain DW4/3-1) TaxID=378806 RepID=E3FDA7_STIAD|nr:uncharacterized protein STAUR_0982 [Stigmatella aurantiaca DW4/3-1]
MIVFSLLSNRSGTRWFMDPPRPRQFLSSASNTLTGLALTLEHESLTKNSLRLLNLDVIAGWNSGYGSTPSGW